MATKRVPWKMEFQLKTEDIARPGVKRMMRLETTWTDAVVRETVKVTPEVRMFEIVPNQGAKPYAPGSHILVSLLVRSGSQEILDTRCYSLIGEHPTNDAHSGPPAYRIAVKRHPESRGAARYMWRLQKGARLRVSNPQNLFVLNLDAPQFLLVAGGIGITPLISMASALRRRRAIFRLLYAGHFRTGMPFVEELRQQLGEHVSFFCSEDGMRIDLAREIESLPFAGEMYVCGPIPLMNAARAAWTNVARPSSCLRFETFASSG